MELFISLPPRSAMASQSPKAKKWKLQRTEAVKEEERNTTTILRLTILPYHTRSRLSSLRILPLAGIDMLLHHEQPEGTRTRTPCLALGFLRFPFHNLSSPFLFHSAAPPLRTPRFPPDLTADTRSLSLSPTFPPFTCLFIIAVQTPTQFLIFNLYCFGVELCSW